MRVLKIIVSLVISFACGVASPHVPAQYDDIAAFVHSLKNGHIIDFVQGELTGDGIDDWAGHITADDADGEQKRWIYILQRTPMGRFTIAGRSAAAPSYGGSGNFSFDGIAIAKRSLFVTVNYHWKSCAGSAVSQFKLQDKQWQMIGLKSFETNDIEGSGIDISSDTNLLTGAAVVTRIRNRKPKTFRLKTQPRLRLLKDYDGSDVWSIHEKTRPC